MLKILKCFNPGTRCKVQVTNEHIHFFFEFVVTIPKRNYETEISKVFIKKEREELQLNELFQLNYLNT